MIKETTKQKLIKNLQDFYKEHQYTPPSNIKNGELYGQRCFVRVFGSWNKAIIAAGLKPNLTPRRIVCKCEQCNKEFTRKQSRSTHPKRKSNRTFCSKSCACIYNQTHKTTGTRRSKFEKYTEQKLIKDYPNLEIHFNRKDAIGSELDIYIPSLKLAIELNGIFHYKQIFSEKQFNQIQNNDARKFEVCKEKEIDLYIINVSEMITFKESNAEPYYNIVKNIIDNKLSGDPKKI